jgi:hypothetical protein
VSVPGAEGDVIEEVSKMDAHPLTSDDTNESISFVFVESYSGLKWRSEKARMGNLAPPLILVESLHLHHRLAPANSRNVRRYPLLMFPSPPVA